MLLQHRLLRLVEAPGLVEAGRDERNVVRLEDRILIAELRKQELGDVHLPGGHSAQDVRMLDERAIGMNLDDELAAARFLHVLDEGAHVARVELAVGIRRGHVPFGLRLRRKSERDGERSDERFCAEHGSILLGARC